MIIEDDVPMEVQHESDWLDMGKAALPCSTSFPSQTKLPNNHQSQTQGNKYTSPAIPDYNTTKT